VFLLPQYSFDSNTRQTPLEMMITEVLNKFDDQKKMLQDFMKIRDNDNKAIQEIVKDIATIKRSVSSGTSSNDMMQLGHWAKQYLVFLMI
jgi:hypothetical protein